MKQRVALFLVTAAVMSGCGKKSDDAPGQEAQMPVNAVVARAVKEPVRDIVEVVGSLEARDAITVVSELDSTITEIAVTEGQQVNMGDPLFQLDDVKTAARLSEAEAAYKVAELTHKRNAGLIEN